MVESRGLLELEMAHLLKVEVAAAEARRYLSVDVILHSFSPLSVMMLSMCKCQYHFLLYNTCFSKVYTLVQSFLFFLLLFDCKFDQDNVYLLLDMSNTSVRFGK